MAVGKMTVGKMLAYKMTVVGKINFYKMLTGDLVVASIHFM